MSKTVLVKKDKAYHIKLNKTRRSRGYTYEDWLVNEINRMPHWEARRLGGSSTGLPDIVAVKNDEHYPELLSIEAKSGKMKLGKKGEFRTHFLRIEPDQIFRCRRIVRMFEAYHGEVMVSFKFSYGNTGKKPLIYHFLLDARCYSLMQRFNNIICDSAGICKFNYKKSTIPHSTLPYEAGHVLLKPYALKIYYDNTPGASVSGPPEPWEEKMEAATRKKQFPLTANN